MSSRHGHALFAMLGVAASLAFAREASAKVCTREDARLANEEAPKLRTWRAVYESYRRYRQCDEGTVAEGYSDSVATLLAERWSRLDPLLSLTRVHPGFEKFVVSHVDTSMSWDQRKSIRESVRLRCPKNAARFCKLVQQEFALDVAYDDFARRIAVNEDMGSERGRHLANIKNYSVKTLDHGATCTVEFAPKPLGGQTVSGGGRYELDLSTADLIKFTALGPLLDLQPKRARDGGP